MVLKGIFTRKRIIAAVCVLAAAVIFTAGFLGGSAGGGISYRVREAEPSDGGSYSYGSSNALNYYAETAASDMEAQKGEWSVPSVSNNDLSTVGASALKNTKLIYTAHMSLQSTEFDDTCQSVKSLAAGCGGYIESESISNGSISSSALRNASFVIRVPAERYEDFIRGIGEDCRVVSMDQSMTDIAEQYFDAEQKLETLRNKHDRLEELLSRADNMSDIIVLENELSDTEYQINRYQGTLNKYDSLVNFSTVSISLREVSRPGTSIDDDQSFFAKLARAFKEGLGHTADGLESIAYWISYNVVGIVIAIAVVIILIKVHPVRRIKAAKAGKKAQAASEETAKA